MSVAFLFPGQGSRGLLAGLDLACARPEGRALLDRACAAAGVTEAELRTSASCDKGGGLVADVGAGNDWRCVVTWRLPGATAIGSAIYQLDVTPDGRYRADGDGPQEVNGFFPIHTATGDVPNPLWQFDSEVDLLTAGSSG